MRYRVLLGSEIYTVLRELIYTANRQKVEISSTERINYILPQFFDLFRYDVCADDRDKVYGFLGLRGPKDMIIEPNYGLNTLTVY